jgi:hypothetical protein
MKAAVFDIDPSRIPDDAHIYTLRRWSETDEDEFGRVLDELQERADSYWIADVDQGNRCSAKAIL